MKRKAPLTMMELMVMIAVFAMASALCLQVFVISDQASRRIVARDKAAVLCQSVAESIQYERGNLGTALERVTGITPLPQDERSMSIRYDTDWVAIPGGHSDLAPCYMLCVTELDTEIQGLGQAKVEIFVISDGEGETLFSLKTSWQKEVGPLGE